MAKSKQAILLLLPLLAITIPDGDTLSPLTPIVVEFDCKLTLCYSWTDSQLRKSVLFSHNTQKPLLSLFC